MMVFVPLARTAAAELHISAAPVEGPGYAATPGLVAAHGFDPSTDDEEGNFQAQIYAMISGLVEGLWPDGSRLVLAVEIPAAQAVQTGSGVELGSVRVTGMEWSQVRAVFSDGAEPDAETTALVRAAGTAVAGLTVSAAARTDDVQRLVDEADLLWHVPDEPW